MHYMSKAKLYIYAPKALISGERISPELTGLYAAVPDKGYKEHKFLIKYFYKAANDKGETVYRKVEREVEDWNRADQFRRFMDKWGRGSYTLGYFRMCDSL